MEALNKFMLETVGPTSQEVRTPSLSLLEDGLMKRAFHDVCTDESWLAQFEGTPLAAQAVALAEQELAIEQRQLQQRMARAAQAQNTNWDQECAERDGVRLQKQQLAIELYKVKAMTPAPKPGDAVIGQPEIANAAALGGGGASAGAAGGAPVEEVAAPKVAQASKLGALLDQALKKVADVTEDKPQLLPELLPFGSTYVGARRGAMVGRPFEGAARGAVGGTLGAMAGSVPGAVLHGIAAQHNNVPLSLMGALLSSGGGMYGGMRGTHMATRGMIGEAEAKKQKAASISKFAKKLIEAVKAA